MPKHAYLGDKAYIEQGELPNMLGSFLQRLRDLVHNPEYTTDDMKDFDKFHRMREDKKLAFLELRMEMEQYRAEKEAELAEIQAAMTEMDFAEAMHDSFAGGPGSEGEGETK